MIEVSFRSRIKYLRVIFFRVVQQKYENILCGLQFSNKFVLKLDLFPVEIDRVFIIIIIYGWRVEYWADLHFAIKRNVRCT